MSNHYKTFVFSFLYFVFYTTLVKSQDQHNNISEGPVAKETHSLIRKKFTTQSKWYQLSSKSIETPSRSSITVSDSVFFKGRQVLRFELKSDDRNVGGSKRVEVIVSKEPKMNVERWYKFRIMLSNDFKIDYLNPEALIQWHETPDWQLGETWRSPPISLQIRKDEWFLVLRWSKNPLNTNETLTGSKYIRLGKFIPGQWIEWTFHIKFSYMNDGITQVWKDGVLVVDRNGPNYYNDKAGPFVKIGFYKWNWKNPNRLKVVNRRVAYFDVVEIGNSRESIRP